MCACSYFRSIQFSLRAGEMRRKRQELHLAGSIDHDSYERQMPRKKVVMTRQYIKKIESDVSVEERWHNITMTVMCPVLQEHSGVTRYLPRSGRWFVYTAEAVRYKIIMETSKSLYNENRGKGMMRQ
jgi:hypothetical protein